MAGGGGGGWWCQTWAVSAPRECYCEAEPPVSQSVSRSAELLQWTVSYCTGRHWARLSVVLNRTRYKIQDTRKNII